jgi:hypothetical protein
MTRARDTDIVKAVLRSPRTARMIYLASAGFECPYTNFTQVKADLRRMTDDGALGRVEVPPQRSGRCEFLYYPKSKAKRLLPELRPFKSTSAVFRVPGTSEHSLFVSEFVSHLERGAGGLADRVEILETKRDGCFTAKVLLDADNGEKPVRLIPDNTFLADIGGTVNLFFLELQNHVRSIESSTKQSISKTFQEKLMKYKAFQRDFRQHPFVREAEELYGCRIPGFRVLIVTTKNELNRDRLVTCARSMGYGELFHFATIEEVRRNNVFTDPMWSLTTLGENRKAALMDSRPAKRYHSKTSSVSASFA